MTALRLPGPAVSTFPKPLQSLNEESSSGRCSALTAATDHQTQTRGTPLRLRSYAEHPGRCGWAGEGISQTPQTEDTREV